MGLRGTRRQLVEIVALSLSIFGWSLLAAPADATTERPAIVPRGLEQGVLTKLNVLRRGHGLVPLRRSSGLAAAAGQHSTEMANRGYFGHSSADGLSFDRRIAHFYPRAAAATGRSVRICSGRRRMSTLRVLLISG
jgi:cysteine-rich secretory family protein